MKKINDIYYKYSSKQCSDETACFVLKDVRRTMTYFVTNNTVLSLMKTLHHSNNEEST